MRQRARGFVRRFQCSHNEAKKKAGTFVFVVIALLVLCVASIPVYAQSDRSISVRASVNAQRVYVGDIVQLSVDVQNSDHADTPSIPETEGFTLQPRGEGNSSQTFYITINGRSEDRSTRSYTFRYALTPTQAGTITIPAISVKIDGVTYTTQPIKLIAVEPTVSTNAKLLLVPDKTTLYVGEPVKVSIVLYRESNSRDEVVSLSTADGVDLSTPTTRRYTQRNQQLKTDQYALMCNSQAVIGVLGSGVHNGKACETLSIEQILTPTAAGEITLGPARIDYKTAVGRRRPSWTDFPNDDLNTYERRVVISEPVKLTVKALPKPAPANFTGLVGVYTLDTAATPTVLNVGDPFTLSIRVGGPEPLDRVPPFDLSKTPGFAGSFKMPSEPALPTVLPTAAIFSLELRPATHLVKELPPLELPYFDTARGEYLVARSKPIPLMVQRTAEVTLDDEPTRDPSLKSPDASETAKADPNGPPPLETSPLGGVWATTIAPIRLSAPGVIATVSAPVALFGAAMVVGVRRRAHERDPGGLRRRRAAARARRRLARGLRAERSEPVVAESLRGFAADLAGVPEEGMTTSDAVEFFRTNAPSLETEARRILTQCDAALFAPIEAPKTVDGSRSAQELIAASRDIVNRYRTARIERGGLK